MAAGDEILIVDASDRDREGMRQLFDGGGYVCTAVATADEARDLVSRKFFPAALVDLDVERPNGGIALAREIRERSPQTALVILTARRSFEGAQEAIRLGAVDIVGKRPEEIAHLRRTVATATDRYRAGDKASPLLRDVKQIVDEAIQVMIAMARRIYAEKPDDAEGKKTTAGGGKPKVLVIDSDTAFLKEVAQAVAQYDWDIAAEMTGGSALDKAGEHKFDIVATRDTLPDLPGSMVLKSLQAEQTSVQGVLYTDPGGNGRIERWQEARSVNVERPFRDAKHLVQHIAALVEERGSEQRDRRVIQKFRAEYADFLKRWADMKSRLDSM